MYRKEAGGDQKTYNALAFKINIPNGATIEKAIFTCTNLETYRAPPQNNIYFRTASPTKSLDFLRTCKYNRKANLEDIVGEWEFPSGSTLVTGKEVSSDGVKNVLQHFIQHSSYTPGTYFQLVMFNGYAGKMFTSKNRIRVLCTNQSKDKLTQPRLYVEWS